MPTQAAPPLSPEPLSSRLAYDFLAYPPSPQTRRAEPLPPTPTVRATVRVSRRRSSTISIISSWATQPDSHAFARGNPPRPSPVSRRPSLFRSPRSARRPSATFLPFFDTSTHTHTPDLHVPGYVSAVVPLPITPRTAAPRLQSFFPSKRDNDYHTDMKFTLAALPRQREGSVSVYPPPLPPAPSKKRGLMRFLRPGPRSRSALKTPVHRQVSRKIRPPSPPPSPTTAAAFRIAHRKRAQYVQHGALPLPLESEVELMQFVDGGSRADAIARLGAAPYTDAAGVVYADEAEAGECLPLLLSPEDSTDDNYSVMEDVFMFASSAPPSPLAPRAPPTLASSTVPLLPRTPTSEKAHDIPFSPLALLSVPARADSGLNGDAGAPEFLHITFDPSMSPTRGRAQRRRPTPLTLSLPVLTGLRPASVMGFDDSFMPSCDAVNEASAVRDTEMGFRGLLRATRRE